MLDIAFIREKQSGILGFAATGHADYADFGEDIVCSAVSALCQTCYLGIDEVAKAENETHIGQSGEMSLLLTGERHARSWEAAQTLLETLALGVASIAEAYPRHLTISDLWR